MSWATHYIAKLQAGETVSFRPRGNSMVGRINSGDLCTVTPLLPSHMIDVGTIVLCRVSGRAYLHLVKSVSTFSDKDRYLIGNNKGGLNGWIGRDHIFGICIAVDPFAK